MWFSSVHFSAERPHAVLLPTVGYESNIGFEKKKTTNPTIGGRIDPSDRPGFMRAVKIIVEWLTDTDREENDLPSISRVFRARSVPSGVYRRDRCVRVERREHRSIGGVYKTPSPGERTFILTPHPVYSFAISRSCGRTFKSVCVRFIVATA